MYSVLGNHKTMTHRYTANVIHVNRRNIVFTQHKRFMLLVRHDKHVYKINSNKRKISCHGLKFSLESLLFVGITKTLKFILI